MSPSRRTGTSERTAAPRRRRKAVLILLCLALAAPVAYALAQRAASASRRADDAAAEKRRAFVPGEILVRFRDESKPREGERESASLAAEGGRQIPVEFESPRGLGRVPQALRPAVTWEV